MALTIDTAYVETFEDNIRLRVQQGDTQLRRFVTEVHNSSESHKFDLLGKAEARAKTSARMASPAGGNTTGGVGTVGGLAWSRRMAIPKIFDAGEQIENQDPHNMMKDPNSKITVTLANAMKRKMDDIIISACNDPAKDGDGNDVAFPAAQILGSADTVIDTDQLLEVNQTFLEADIDPDIERVLVINPTLQRALLNQEKITSADYQAVKALSGGYMPNILGFHHVIVSNRLGQTTTPPAAGSVYALAFTTEALGLHVNEELWANTSIREDMSYAIQFYTAMSMGAVRIEDEHVIRLWLKDAIS